MGYASMGSNICYTDWDIVVTHFGSPPEQSQVERRERHYESDRGSSWNPIVKAKARKLAGRRKR